MSRRVVLTLICLLGLSSLSSWAQAVWGTPHMRYSFKELIKPEEHQRELRLVAWRGETLNAQLVVVNRTDVEALYEVALSPLRGKGGKLRQEGLELGWVDEVITDRFSHCGRHELEAYGRFRHADRVVLKSYFLLPQGEQRGVWVSLPIPQEAKAGEYKSEVIVRRAGKKLERLRLVVEVRDRALPEAQAWSFFLDFWQNPYAVARVHGVKLWSAEHFAAMRPYMERLARSGQKVITATLIDRPWDGQTYDAFGSMVEWRKGRDGVWSYDFGVFDKWVEFMHSCGITREIACFSMIPWKLSFRYHDEASGEYKHWKAAPGEALYVDRWGHFLAAFEAHLKAKGWLSKTSIAMDERSMEQMQQAIALIRRHAPGISISMAGNYHPEIQPFLSNYCVDEQSKGQYTPEVIRERKAAGKISTYYTCCSSLGPNTFTFSPTAEAVFIPWYALRKDLDGYLRWAYNSWTIDPNYDSRFTAWSSGDTYIIYPDNYPSVRWLRLVEGIQQFEKYKILLAEAERTGDKARVDELTQLLERIDISRLGNKVEEMVDEAQRTINAM